MNQIVRVKSQIINLKGDVYAEPLFTSAVALWGAATSGLHLNEYLSEQEKLITQNWLFINILKRRNTMDHPENLTGGRNAKQCINKNNTNNEISKRSKIMQCATVAKNLGRGFSAILIIALIATMALGQNLVIGSGSTYGGAGAYVVKGNITNPGVAAATTIGGSMTMNSATALQTIGTAGQGVINFGTLNINTSFGAKTTTMAVSTGVSTNLSIAAASGYVVGANTLTIDAISSIGAGGALTTVAGSTVVYDGAAAQTVLGLTYAGAVTLSGAGAKNLGADVTVNGAFGHAGGALTVDNNLTISSATPSLATIATVGAGKALTLSGTGAKGITTVTTTTATGTIANTGATGLLTIGTLSDNLGSITGGASGLTFTNGATNHGTITGAAGPVTFSGTLAQAGGTITAGAGTVAFNGVVTQTGGSIASSALANVLNFNAAVANTAGTIDLTATGSAQFASTVNTTGLNFATGTTVTYDGVAAGQVIADVNYGNLVLTSGTKAWTLAAARTINNNLDVQASSATIVNGAFDLNVTGNVTLASTLTKNVAGNPVSFANAASTVSGTSEIVGSVRRTHAFVAASPYTFNNAATVVTPSVVGTLSSMTISSSPATNPTGYLAGNSVNRKYSSAYVGAGFTADVQLGYIAGEYTGSLPAKLKFFQGGIAKANKIGGAYTPGVSGSFSYVKLAALAQTSLTSGLELGIDDRYNMFISKAIANWDVATTWDVLAIPGASDDVEIAPTFAVTIPNGYAAVAQSVTIDAGAATGGLSFAGPAGSLAVGAGGVINNNVTGNGLTLVAGTSVTITGGDLTNNGKITNAGTITVQ